MVYTIYMTCVIDGCDGKVVSRGLCSKHYRWVLREGKQAEYPKNSELEIRTPRHGTYTEYSNHGCRCDLCRAAWNGFHSALQREKRTKLTEGERVANNATNSSNIKRRRQYREQLDNRAGVCDICSKQVGALHVDHDHETGEVRGFLCSSCNTGLGKLGDNVDGLKRAIEYLENRAPDLW